MLAGAYLLLDNKISSYHLIEDSIHTEEMFSVKLLYLPDVTVAAENCPPLTKHISHQRNKFCDRC
jgi:hypothetical protein